MASFIINGGKKLSGSIEVGGAKNAVLPMLAATLLTRQPCIISNVPEILDVQIFLRVLEGLGARVKRSKKNVTISCDRIFSGQPDKKLTGSMRASVVLLGALLARSKKAVIGFPGVHVRASEALGAKVSIGRKVSASARTLIGSEVFAESSVTGTENIILASVLAKGTTVIKLAAQEPHVVALCQFLNKMGAKISGIGTHTITIRGVRQLHGTSMATIPDMIEAGSLAVLGAVTKSEIEIKSVNHGHLDAVYNKLSEMGVRYEKSARSLIILRPLKPYRRAVIRTGLYPNLATDLQPPFGVLASIAFGTSVIHDWIFEGRLGYLAELSKMGAKVRVLNPHQAEITGPAKLSGGRISSLDIRSGITLLIAALAARGKSVISQIHHIDRGYERIEDRLTALGADIKRI